MNSAHFTTKMVVRNLSPEITVERLSQLFSAHGAVRSVRLATDVMTGRCTGIGYVSLDEPATGAAAGALDKCCLGGRRISVAVERKKMATRQ